jgi:MSHA pilin protein MshD
MTRRASRRGLSIVEASVCTVVVGLMLAAALNASGAARARQQRNQDRGTGLWLAQSLMTEIVEKPYADVGGLLGLELGESHGQRSTLNDLDDYDGLKEEPPRKADGTVIPGYTGWSRSVSVDNVLSSNLRSKSASDTGIRRVTVTVRKGRVVVAQLQALRSKARDAW